MKRLALISISVLMVGCGSSGDGDSRTGTGGVGGGSVPAEVDAACRAFCANEPEGSTCGPAAYLSGTVGNVQECYEQCLRDSVRTDATGEVSCQSEWLSLLDCHLKLDCDDLFGDCDDLVDPWASCWLTPPISICGDPPSSCFDPLFESDVLRTKLEGCAGDPVLGGCHLVANPTNMELDLTNPATTVEAALSLLLGQSASSGDPFIDVVCVGDSVLLRKLTSDPGFGSRQPLDGDYWTNDEVECFRSYLTKTFMQAGVGTECTASSQCGSPDEAFELECLPQFKGGYCGLEGCDGDDKCPEGSACVTHEDGVNYCFRVCVNKYPDCNFNRDAENEANCNGSGTVDFVDLPNERKVCVPTSGS